MKYIKTAFTYDPNFAPNWHKIHPQGRDGRVFTRPNSVQPLRPTLLSGVNHLTSFTNGHDHDGNLLKDGRFSYTWDCENRLISAETLTNLPSSVPRVRVEFEYDYMSRRVSKTVGRRTGGGLWQLMGETSFLYDSWNLIREVGRGVPAEPSSTNFYFYGLDLSGSLQGAGGIGGLLAAQLGTNSVFYTYDGNGNVSELINTLDGTIAAHYEYSPFGEVLVATGDLAGKNPFQFSTKYFDAETGLNNYGYRYYSPSLGRWVSRDPIEEEGGINLYGFVGNSTIDYCDYLGLDDWPWPFTGRVKVDPKCNKTVRSIDMDNSRVYTGSTPWNVDVDFVEIDGKWYKIGSKTYNVDVCCKPAEGFRQATPEEVKDINNKINKGTTPPSPPKQGPPPTPTPAPPPAPPAPPPAPPPPPPAPPMPQP